MKKNESVANDRWANPIPVYDADGKLKTGLTFLTASGEVFTYSISGGWVAAAANAVEDGTSGNYRYQYSQAETNFDSIIGVKLVKAGYDTVYFWTPIELVDLDDLSSALTSIASSIATLTGYVDTEVAAIKAKTDQLTFASGYVEAYTKIMGTNMIDWDVFVPRCLKVLSGSAYPGPAQVHASPAPTRTALRIDASLSGADNSLKGAIALCVDGTGSGWFAVVATYDDATGDMTFEGTGWPDELDNTSYIWFYINDQSDGVAGNSNITQVNGTNINNLIDGRIDAHVSAIEPGIFDFTSLSELGKKLIAGTIAYDLNIDSFDDETVVLHTGTYDNGELRGCLLQAYEGTGAPVVCQIAYNDGSNGRTLHLVGGDGWGEDPSIWTGEEDSTPTYFAIIRHGDGVATAHKQRDGEEEGEIYNLRQTLLMVEDVHVASTTNLNGAVDPEVAETFRKPDDSDNTLEATLDRDTGVRDVTWNRSPL